MQYKKFIINLEPDVIIVDKPKQIMCAITYRPDLGYKEPLLLSKAKGDEVKEYIEILEREGKCIYEYGALARCIDSYWAVGGDLLPDLYTTVARILAEVYWKDQDDEEL